MSSFPPRASLATTVLLLVACGGASSAEDPFEPAGADTSVIVVDNRGSTVSDATIYLLPQGGIRDRLGSVQLGREVSFTVRPRTSTQYQLVARVGTREMVSRTFSLSPGDVISWDLAQNAVYFGGRR